ncbi:protein spaetzle isoform X2 [Copidosoma floridanum]|nr:protein spaetzle isoform X2 [Copidosoma floridanum]
MNSSYLSWKHETKGYSHLQTERNILSQETDNFSNNSSRIDGKIVFPTEESPFLVPSFNHVCENATFCENTTDYPEDFIENLLRTSKDIKSLFSGADLIPDVENRLNVSPEDASLCNSYEKVIFPRVAESKDKESLLVVNHGSYKQAVRVEICGNEDNECSVINATPEGYKTFCKQKYVYKMLVSVSSTGHLKQEPFRFPANCCCHIKFYGNPQMRLGGSSLKKKFTINPKTHR